MHCRPFHVHIWRWVENPFFPHFARVAVNWQCRLAGFEEEINQFSCDVHCLNLKTMHWSYIQTSGTPPSYRDFHSATILDNRMYIFGGRGDRHSPYHSQEEIYYSQIVYLDLKTREWHTPNAVGTIPVGRRSHSAFVYNNLLYVFGGYNGTSLYCTLKMYFSRQILSKMEINSKIIENINWQHTGIIDQHFNDLYCFEPKLNTWSRVITKGNVPRARRRQVCLVVGKRLFLFGGTR